MIASLLVGIVVTAIAGYFPAQQAAKVLSLIHISEPTRPY